MVDSDAEVRQAYSRFYGEWDARLDRLLELAPDFVRAHLRMVEVAWDNAELSEKTKHLISLALDVATTHLYEPGVRAHIRAALRLGATREEVVEVLQLVAVLGMHSCNVGVPILLEELGDAGERLMGEPLTGVQQDAKDRYRELRGNWGPHWERLVRLSPAFLSAYTDYSMTPWREGPLDGVTKELIYVAVNVSTTHLYTQGLRVHIRNALAQGATLSQLMTVFQLATSLGWHSVAMGAPLLAEEAATAATHNKIDRP